jgi:opacity protein-like surface antigen
VTFGHINWDRAVTVHKFGFAWALMAGVAYDLTTHAKLDLGYHYLNLGQGDGRVIGLGRHGELAEHQLA